MEQYSGFLAKLLISQYLSAQVEQLSNMNHKGYLPYKSWEMTFQINFEHGTWQWEYQRSKGSILVFLGFKCLSHNGNPSS
jgi:hypothetical protein